MKKVLTLLTAFVMTLLAAVSISADVTSTDQIPSYSTNYYVIVEGAEEGIDIYPAPNATDTKLNVEPIKNGTILHVDGEKRDESGKLYGYVEYHAMKGYVPLEHTRVISAEEARQAAIAADSSEAVDYDAEAYGRAGSVAMYDGPSDQFDVIDGSTAIPNGENFHVSAEVENTEGETWLQATHDGVEGWIQQEQLLTEEQKAVLSATPTPSPTPEPTATPTPKPTSTPTPKPTATNTPTPKPTNTNTPTPKPTPKPTATNTPTPEPTATNTPTPEPTNTNTPTPEAVETPTEAPESVSEDSSDKSGTAGTSAEGDTAETVSTQAEDAASSSVSPALIGAGIALIVLLIILLIALKRKKDKDNK